MGSIGIDHQGNIGIGYSFGGDPNFAGQRFAGRLASDKPGSLTFSETVLVEGEAAQTNTLRWQDYTTTAMDPSDDCTFWYVCDYLKRGADGYSTRIGGIRMPGCLHSRVMGSAYYDLNHDGRRESDKSGLQNVAVQSSGSAPSRVITDGRGDFKLSLPTDTAYEDSVYTITEEALPRKMWGRTRIAAASTSGIAVAQNGTDYTVHLADCRVWVASTLGTFAPSATAAQKTSGSERRLDEVLNGLRWLVVVLRGYQQSASWFGQAHRQSN